MPVLSCRLRGVLDVGGRRGSFGSDLHCISGICIDADEHRDRRQADEGALRASGLKSKLEVVEEGLRTLLRLKRQEDIRKFRGKLA